MRYDVVRPAAGVQFLGRLFVALLLLSVTAGCGTEIEIVNPEIAPVQDLWKFTSEVEAEKLALPTEMLPATTSTVAVERTSETERHFNAFDMHGGEYVMIVDPRTEGFPHVLSKGDLVYRNDDGSTVVDTDVWTADVSNDGRTLAVWKDPGVIEVKRDGAVIRTIGNADFPRVSPDGTMVVVRKNNGALFVPENGMGIVLIDITSGVEVQITDEPADFSPFWLNDEWIMFGGSGELVPGGYTAALFTASIKTRKRVQITNNGVNGVVVNHIDLPSEYPSTTAKDDVATVVYDSMEDGEVMLRISIKTGELLYGNYINEVKQ